MPKGALLHEGYVKWLPPTLPGSSSPTKLKKIGKAAFHSGPKLVDRYCELIGRNLIMYSNIDKAQRTNTFDIYGFCQWKGDGLLSIDSYGLELKTSSSTSIYIAAYNRLDLENWCRAFMAAIDPKCEAAEELRRQRQKERRKIRKQKQKESEQRQLWHEHQKKKQEIERLKMIQRQEEIQNMTPLERADGLGSLDQDTAKLLQRRRNRRQRRHAPTTGRVGRNAYRRRIDEAAGGRVDNVQPLSQKTVDSKPKVRVEAPPPGQFIEVSESTRRRGSGPPRTKTSKFQVDNDLPSPTSESESESESESQSESAGSSEDDASSSEDSFDEPMPPQRKQVSQSQYIPPPPPPPSEVEEVAPPPPPPEEDDSDDEPPPPPPPFRQDRLSFSSSTSKKSTTSIQVEMHSRPSMNGHAASSSSRSIRSNPLQASLAAVLMKTSSQKGKPTPSKVGNQRQRTRKSQLSAEGKDMLMEAMTPPAKEPSRKGLFDDSSEEDDDLDQPLFTTKTNPPRSNPRRNERVQGNLGADTSRISRAVSRDSTTKRANSNIFDDSDDSSEAEEETTPIARQITSRAPVQQMGTRNSSGSSVNRAVSRDSTTKRANSNIFDDSDDSSEAEEETIPITHQVASRATVQQRSSSIFEDSDDSSRKETPKSTKPALQQTNSNIFEDSDDSSECPTPIQEKALSPNRAVPKNPMMAALKHEIAAAGVEDSPDDEATQPVVPVTSFGNFSVSAVAHEVKRDRKKPYAVYTFEFRLGQISHRISYSYHEMHEIHSRLGDNVPKFPSKHWYRNNTKLENMLKRSKELEEYLAKIVENPEIRTSERFHFEYKFPRTLVDALVGRTTNRNTTTIVHTSPQPSAPVVNERSTNLFDESGESDNDSISSSDSVKVPEPKYNIPNAVISPSSTRSRGSTPTQSPAREETAKIPQGLPAGRPNLFGGGRGALLAAIRTGTTLAASNDTADQPSPPPVTTLSSTEKSASIGDAISNAMAARRVNIEVESEEDSDADSDDW